MSTNAANRATSRNDPQASVVPEGQSFFQEALKGGFVRCLGPAGTWPCAREFGHPGDHERFRPELLSAESEILAGVRNLRAERDALLLTCADLLAVLKRASGALHGDYCGDVCRTVHAAIERAEW